MTHEEILQRLREGNQRFMNDKLECKLQNQERRAQLMNGQEPHTIVLSCADSRVVPELAFDMGLGELFTVRVAGNIANPSSLASIEYAVAHCKSKMIVVMGHEECGAVKAAMGGGVYDYTLNHLLGQLKPALEKAGDNATTKEVVQCNAKHNAEDMLKRSSIISGAVENGTVKIVAAYYQLSDGEVVFLD